MGLFGDLFSEALMNGEWTVSDDNEEETVPDYYGDDYYDTEGNASLVKENNIIHESEEMQCSSVTTRDGSVFYVLIDYTDETDNVYFLNKVDAYDLYALLYAVEDQFQYHTLKSVQLMHFHNNFFPTGAEVERRNL